MPNPGVPDIQPTPQPGWTGTSYTYGATKPHAVTGAGSSSYTYDANGNMTCRAENGVSFVQVYNAENRLATVKKLSSGTCSAPGSIAAQWDFSYDGDGNRVRQVYTEGASTLTTLYFMGGAYEVTVETGAVKKYYSIAGQTVAMDDGSGLKYLLTDHLGSVVAVTNAQGAIVEQHPNARADGHGYAPADRHLHADPHPYPGPAGLHGRDLRLRRRRPPREISADHGAGLDHHLLRGGDYYEKTGSAVKKYYCAAFLPREQPAEPRESPYSAGQDWPQF